MSEQAEIETAAVEEATPAPITSAVVEYSELLAGLNEMQKLRGMAYDLRTVKGNDDARRDRQKLVKSRTWLDKRRLELNAADRATIAERVALRNSEAERLEGLIRELETPIDEQIRADETRRETERVEKLRAEEARTSAHRQRITDISNVAVRAVGLSAAEIDQKIALVTRIDIDASFEEFEAVAGNTKFETLLKLKELHAGALVSEEAAAEAARNKARLVELEAQEAARLQREDAERREREALEAQQRESQQKAERGRRSQSDAANALVNEIRVVQRRAFTSSAAGMLELVTLIENIRIGNELGDFAGVAQKARDDALADLHDLHKTMVAQEAEKRAQQAQQDAARLEQQAAQRRLDDAAAELARRQELIDAHELAAKVAEAEAAADAIALARGPIPIVAFDAVPETAPVSLVIGDSIDTEFSEGGPAPEPVGPELLSLEQQLADCRAALTEALEWFGGWLTTKCPKKQRARHMATIERLATLGGLPVFEITA